MKAPSFWSHKGLFSTALLPLSLLYQGVSAWRRFYTRPYKSTKPVICVGNLTSGGTGKTPICAELAQMIKKAGLRPVILSRGYGGSLSGPVLLALDKYTAMQTGDEPRLLSQSAPVVISANRAKGAAFIEKHLPCDVIIMDDGLQNPQLIKDFKIGVFDGEIGIQNGRLFPAGPLRTSIGSGQKMLDLILINGADKTAIAQMMRPLPSFGFHLAPPKKQQPTDKSFIAFAGIGRPKRFFDALSEHGFHVINAYEFGDHHLYREAELTKLSKEADANKARLITTEKDWVRLAPSWQKLIDYYPVRLTMTKDDKDQLSSQIFQSLGL